MGKYFLRVEAVNLGNTVYDTADLSTIRGGSQLQNNAGERIQSEFGDMKAITMGASVAMFEFHADSDKAASQRRADVYRVFAENDELRHMTFVVDVTADTGNFPIERETLLALIRRRQMRTASIAFPSPALDKVCEMDGIRPAAKNTRKGHLDTFTDYEVSESVWRRREYGRDEKHSMLAASAKKAGLELRTAEDFEILATGAPQQYAQLENKMAVLFLDGNGFGMIQSDVCLDTERQADFDKALRNKSEEIKDALLKAALLDAKRWFNNGMLRLEVLMLAGDDMRLVVPAWCGWTALHIIFDALRGWKQFNKDLTYKAGLVFCQYHAPIKRMMDLANNLADFAKNNAGALKGQNVFAYAVLESFDVVGDGEPKKFQWASNEQKPEYVLSGLEMKQTAETVQLIRKHIPRGKLHRAVQEFATGDPKQAEKTITKELDEVSEPHRSQIRHWAKNAAMWLHALELADYAVD